MIVQPHKPGDSTCKWLSPGEKAAGGDGQFGDRLSSFNSTNQKTSKKEREVVRLLFLQSRWEDMEKKLPDWIKKKWKKPWLPENNICDRERMFISLQT